MRIAHAYNIDPFAVCASANIQQLSTVHANHLALLSVL